MKLDPDMKNKQIREPSLWNSSYILYRTLSQILLSISQEILGGSTNSTIVKVLDIGCGSQPYRPYFEKENRTYYIGLDLVIQPGNGVIGLAEPLPFADASIDIVLCTQVLEHVSDPVATLAEIYRVLKDDGTALVSTHGVYFYHPHDHDYWRWTHEGLCLIHEAVGFSSIQIIPNGGTIACFAFLFARYVDLFTSQTRLLWPFHLLIPVANVFGRHIDPLIPRLHHPERFTMIANYMVVAQK